MRLVLNGAENGDIEGMQAAYSAGIEKSGQV